MPGLKLTTEMLFSFGSVAIRFASSSLQEIMFSAESIEEVQEKGRVRKSRVKSSYHSIIAHSLLAPYRRKPELMPGSSSGRLHCPLARTSAPGNSVGYLVSLYALIIISLRESSILQAKELHVRFHCAVRLLSSIDLLVGPATDKEDASVLRIHALQEKQRQEHVGQKVDMPSHFQAIFAHNLARTLRVNDRITS